MSGALIHTFSDSMTMLRRNLKHALRYPAMTITVAAMPVVMLLLFVYVFGGALGTGVGPMGGSGGDADYIDYAAPGIILMAATSGSLAMAVSISVDMTEGIINRFRTMAISRASVLVGHVVGSVLQTLVAITLVTGLALVMGFRPNATVVEWLAVLGLLTLVTVALTWLSAAMGLACRSPETASNAPMPLQFLPFLGSAIVPTDSMPTGLRWFAEYQPYTPIIETLRGLLMGTEIGNSGIIAVAWCVGLTVVGFLWARALFRREPRR
ncbi:ABC transporter permease [Streptomyces sparsogenes]|uniref:Transport permease protein n=1 Tax=Streptomyces sparsogenes DSM 40356 TaxID=1331668 RepID=A0A1R1SL28_9ACTN|nr:ABC transporter permease [Streptomyces sparsogenes]OMI39011.1 ABC transporter permease [Streptomyces sparsogenes DSM 40356]